MVQVALPADTSLPPSIDGLIENNGLGPTSHNNVRTILLTRHLDLWNVHFNFVEFRLP